MALRELSHHYPGKRKAPPRAALDRVSFDVQAGEVFGLLGPNGGGKSTLLGILTTLLTPRTDRGVADPDAARVFGHSVIDDPDAVRRQIGLVFQSPSIDGQLTCRENLACHARLYGVSGRDLRGRVDAELERAGLADRGGELAGGLSGGLKRRLEIAKAVLPGPRLVLMDEPDTGLDVAARRRLWAHVGELKQRGVTVVVATHLMDAATRCDRVAVLHEGRLLACDTPEAVRSRVAGDVVTLELDPVDRDREAMDAHLDAAAKRLADRFGPFPDGGGPRVVQGRVRFEHEDAARLVPRLAEDLDRSGSPLRSLTVGKPTMEDAFVHLTATGEGSS